MSEQVILQIVNRHFDGCGVPPNLSLGKVFTSYFANCHGEQAIIQYDPEKNTARLWMGDVGWEEELRVEEFRGRPVVLFARGSEERRRESKMNRQFDIDLPPRSQAEEGEVREAIYAAYRKVYGKPRLSDEECEYLSNSPTLSQDEMRVISALWESWRSLAAR